MKKWCVFSALFLSFCLFAACFAPLVETGERVSRDVFRLHILANSDSADDQRLKLMVRDDVLRACSFFEDCTSVSDAKQAAEKNLQQITQIAQRRIRREGYSYSVTAHVVYEYFSTRVYEQVTLPAGYYQALKIEIGAGTGHNWWCVLFPAVCLSACSKEDLSAYLDKDEVKLIENGDGYAVRFKVIEIYQKIKEKLK